MLRLLAVVLILAVATPAFAQDQDKPKPNTLTPKEIAEGWVLLFDGATTFGWKIDGAAEVKDGMLILGKGKKTSAYPTANFGPLYTLKVEWRGKGSATVGRTELNFTQLFGGARWGGIQYEWNGKDADLTINGGGGINAMQNEAGKPGQPAVSLTTDGVTPAILRSVKIRPLNSKSLFTGKNLDGLEDQRR